MVKETEVENHVGSLIRYAKLIFSKYDSLYNYEIDGTKNSNIQKYEKEKILLDVSLKNMTGYCSSLSSDIDMIIAIKKYLNEILKNPEKLKKFKFEETISLGDAKVIVSRIMAQFNPLINKYTNNIHGVSKEISDGYKEIEVNDYINTEVSKNYLFLMRKDINKVLERISVASNINKNNLQRLIQMKYDTSFLNLEIEHHMIANNFEVSDDLFKDSKSKLDELGISDGEYNKIKNKRIISVLQLLIPATVNISDHYLRESDKNIMGLLLNYFYIRSLLLMLDIDEMTKVSNWFFKDICLEEYNKSISKGMIIEIFENCYYEDQSNYKYLTENSPKR